MTIDPKLLDYCLTDRQRKRVQAVLDHSTQTAAAKALGVDYRRLAESVAAVKKRAARAGWSPEHGMVNTVPDGFAVKGTSTLYDRRDGSTVMQWVKTSQDQARQEELMRAAVAEMSKDLPHAPPVPPPQAAPSDLLNLHILSDYHVGCLSWGEETRGDDWDTNIAIDLLAKWWGNLIDRAPDAETGIFCQLGDLLHADNLDAMTPASGHRLDVDSRLAYVVRVVVQGLRLIMDMMLRKYPKVHVIISDANHDPTGAIWMREMMCEHWRLEPRVTVDQSPSTFNAYEHGNTSLFFHHGHMVKPDSIGPVMAETFREMYGRTKYSYAHIGHRHHYAAKDQGQMIVTQHPTIAAKDNYAASHGYTSQRFATVTTYSAESGRVGDSIVTPEMVKCHANAK